MDAFVLLLGLILVGLIAIYLALTTPGRRKRILSPAVNSEKSYDGTVAAPPSYKDVFPPTRRTALGSLPADAMKGPGPSTSDCSRRPPDYTRLLPDKSACDTNALLHHSTPTGFTLEEIRRLGDFPDYATLSGTPLPPIYEGFDVKKALSRPYRPFRWPYHQTMSLSKLENDFWLELDQNYAQTIKQRLDLYRQHGTAVLEVLPGSELACKELMEVVLQWLCARHPQYFTLADNNTVFRNAILGTETDLKIAQPLHVLLQNVPEDFVLMLRDPITGLYSFRAGVIMSSLGWNLASKIGLQLHEIHSPVPDYPEKMQFSMDRYFAKMPTDKGIQRGSWGLEVDKPLYMAPGDPQERLKEQQDPDLTLDRCHLRVDWQTLRRLPLSGGIIFNFKGLFTPVKEFRDEPGVPSLILKVLKEGKPNILEYKNAWHVQHVVIPALEAYEREQLENGLIGKDHEVKTMEESPFFPGWEEKWRRQQGF